MILESSVDRFKQAQYLLMQTISQKNSFTQRVKIATNQIARTGARITALQLLAIAGYYASLCLVLRAPVRTLWPVQLRNPG